MIVQAGQRRSVGRHRADHDVGMAAEIFGAGMDREVDAEIERAEIERARPGIVHEHEGAFGMRRRGNRRDVLHLETQRTGRFDEDGAGIFPNQRVDPAADEGIVIGGGDAEPGQDLVAKRPRRSVDAVGDQKMVARPHNRRYRRRNRPQSRRQKRDAGALRPFQLLHGEFERFGRRRAATAVLIAGAAGDEILGAGIKHRRGVVDWRVDEAVLGGGIAPGIHHAGIRMARRGAVAFAAVIHGHCLSRSSPDARGAPPCN